MTPPFLVGSLFSGVGGFEQGFEAAGFRVAWQVEIDKDASSVLERHYPNVPRWRDVTEVDPADLSRVDVVVFGSPCQDMSVAGKRAGLVGERSGLFHEAVRIIGGLRPAPAFCIWENVPGALSSSRGRDFGAVLDALADIGALDIGWRVLDARHFGVPQRRRRVFLVADFGGRRAGQVLFESPRGDGDSAESFEAGQGAAGDAEDGAGGAGTGQGGDPSFTLDTTGAAAVAFHLTQDPINGAESPALGAGNAAGCATVGVAFHEDQRSGAVYENDHTHALSATGGGKPGQGYQAVREGMAVRRLTPRECEALQGWSRDWTRWRADGSEIPDGPRYRMIGNGVVAPVAAWLGRRLVEALR